MAVDILLISKQSAETVVVKRTAKELKTHTFACDQNAEQKFADADM